MSYSKILVTGGAGFIGSNFIKYMLNAEPELEIINLDALTYAGNEANLQGLDGRHHFYKGDISDKQLVKFLLNEYGIKAIVHFAAESHVEKSISEPEDFIQANIVGTFNLLEVVKQIRDFRLFLHISTDEVYGSLQPDEIAWSELSPYGPRSPYSASKASSDFLVRAYGNTYGVPYIITNCSNNYGRYQHPEKLIPKMILRGIKREPLTIHGDGLQVRDWLHVSDCCSALNLVLRAGNVGETYNIGGGNECSVQDVIYKICFILDDIFPDRGHHDELIEHIEDRTGQDRRYALNTEKIRRELMWSPKISLDDGLLDTVKWYIEQESGQA